MGRGKCLTDASFVVRQILGFDAEPRKEYGWVLLTNLRFLRIHRAYTQYDKLPSFTAECQGIRWIER